MSALNKVKIGGFSIGALPPMSMLGSIHNLKIGHRVVLDNNLTGVIRWTGSVDTKYVQSDTYCGIQLDEPAGESDGMFRGKRYFRCPMYHGIMVKVSRIVQYKKPRDMIYKFQTKETTASLQSEIALLQLNRPRDPKVIEAERRRKLTYKKLLEAQAMGENYHDRPTQSQSTPPPPLEEPVEREITNQPSHTEPEPFAELEKHMIRITIERNSISESFGFAFQDLNFDRPDISHIISRVNPGTPADIAGLEVGYIIRKCNDICVTNMHHDEFLHLVKSKLHLELSAITADAITRAIDNMLAVQEKDESKRSPRPGSAQYQRHWNELVHNITKRRAFDGPVPEPVTEGGLAHAAKMILKQENAPPGEVISENVTNGDVFNDPEY